MTQAEIKSAIQHFFWVIDSEMPSESRELELQKALDKLALSVHHAVCSFDENSYPDPPKKEYPLLRGKISPKFPDCGFYNVAHEIAEKVSESSVSVGDAIDDICDIAGDLEEVLWRWENTSSDDALWHFRESFGWHWGKHLRDLQLYLYAKHHGW